MTIKCIANKSSPAPLVLPKNPSEPLSDVNFVSSSEWYSIDSNLSGYCLTIGKNYPVMGLILFHDELRYLISDDKCIPGFFSSDLFEVTVPNLLFDWEMNRFLLGCGQLFVLGYTELAQNYAHLTGLIDGREQEIQIYLRYKDKQMERTDYQ